MAWKRMEISEQRLKFVMAASDGGLSMTEACGQFGVSRQTGYVWLKRYREGGARAVLEEASRRPHRIEVAGSEQLRQAIQRLRLDKPDWGARKLLRVVQAKHPELKQEKISATSVHRMLDRQQLIAPEDRRPSALQRFERKEPNELWQMDFKGPQGFNRGQGPLSMQDDYSRYVLALKHLENMQMQGVKRTMEEIFDTCGLPMFLLIDHGTPWYNSWNPWGLTELSIWILMQGVQIILSGVRHPQTQGKIERMHGSLQRAIRKRKGRVEDQAWLDEFREEYNHLRPHEGIGMVVPAQRWQPSPRRYQPQPREWEYPSSCEVHRLSGQGQLQWQKRRWEISNALRGQTVGLRVNGERVLVYFCNVALREFNLRSGQNIALPANPFRLLQS